MRRRRANAQTHAKAGRALQRAPDESTERERLSSTAHRRRRKPATLPPWGRSPRKHYPYASTLSSSGVLIHVFGFSNWSISRAGSGFGASLPREAQGAPGIPRLARFWELCWRPGWLPGAPLAPWLAPKRPRWRLGSQASRISGLGRLPGRRDFAALHA